MKADRAKMNKAVFDALKPGGVYGIVDHSAATGSGTRDCRDAAPDRRGGREAGGARGRVQARRRERRAAQPGRQARLERVAARGRASKRGTSDRFVLRFVKP